MNFLSLAGDLNWIILAGVNILLLFILDYRGRNRLHTLLLTHAALLFCLFSLIVFLFAGKYHLVLGGIAVLVVLVREIRRKQVYKIQRTDLSIKPIIVMGLFIGGYILGIAEDHSHSLRINGYLFAVVSFVVGIFVYRPEPKKYS